MFDSRLKMKQHLNIPVAYALDLTSLIFCWLWSLHLVIYIVHFTQPRA